MRIAIAVAADVLLCVLVSVFATYMTIKWAASMVCP